MRRIIAKWSIPAVLAAFLITACVIQKNPVSGRNRAYGYTWEQEIQIGKEADQQIQQQYGVYDDEELSAYVNKIGQQTLAVSHLRREDTEAKYKNTEFHFRVLNSPVVNAFALPGGYVYVTRGLLSYLDNEAQLSVVLGHEIGHVAARHASQKAFEQSVGQIALVGGAIAGQELLGLPGQDLLNLGSTATQLLFLQYSRDDEREADRLGVEYAAMQHYEADQASNFFVSLKRMSAKSGQSIPSFLSTHPEPGEREQTIKKLAEDWKEKGYDQSIIHQDDYMNEINGIIFGENPREGFVRDNTFYHPELKFEFPIPSGWQVINEPNQVILANKDGNAVTIMQVDSDASDARESVQNFTGQDGITVTQQSSADSGGLTAYQATAQATTQDGTELGIYVYGIEYGGNIYRFISYTTQEQYSSQRSNFINTTNGFKELTDSDILNIQPVRLQVIRADHSGSFSSFVPKDLPMNVTAEDLAIVNQVQLNDQIESGDYLKLPEQ